jgi:benzoate/toluate 1,2-dioxygenase reductase subunit
MEIAQVSANMHEITSIFEDSKAVKFSARHNEVIYQAAYRSGIKLEHDCLEGACGECKALCTQGEFELDDYSDEALSEHEREQGYTLLCRMRAKTPCVIELPYPSGHLASQHEAQWVNASVSAVEWVSSSVKRLLIRTSDAGATFLPGQYIHMEVPGTELVRSYSFANSPGDEELEFFLKVYPEGGMSDYLRTRAAQGDAIRIKGPVGHFYLRPARRPILMVAGGTGLAPMLSMLRTLAALRSGVPPIHLIYGVNEASEFFGDAALESLRLKLPLTIEKIAVSSSGWSGPTGHVTTLLRPEATNSGDCDAYLCGPPPMVEAATNWLQNNGVGKERIHAERFISSN